MSKRAIPFVLIALTLLAVNIALAGNVHQVTIVQAGAGKLTCVDGNGSQHTIKVAANAKITCDGKTCKLEELRKDFKAAVTGERIDDEKTITSIEARSK